MRHINFSDTSEPHVEDEWLSITAQATDFVIDATGLSDLLVKVGPGLAAEAGTAQFSPATHTIQVDTNLFLPGVDPATARVRDPLFQERYPMFMGAILHESGHALSTHTMTPAKLAADGRFSNRALHLLVSLEEPRCERVIMDRKRTLARRFLPSLVWELICKDLDVPDDRFGASLLAALTLGRGVAGILPKSDLRPIRDAIETVIDPDTLLTLEGLMAEYIALDLLTVEVDGMVTEEIPYDAFASICERWFEALGMTTVEYAAEAKADADARTEAEAAEGGEGEGEGGAGEAEDESEGGESAGAGEGAEDGAEGAEDGAGAGEGGEPTPDAGKAEASAEGAGLGEGEREDEGGKGKGAPDDGKSPVGSGASADGDGSEPEGEPKPEGLGDLLDKIREAARDAAHEDAMDHVEKVGDLRRKVAEAERRADVERRKLTGKAADRAVRNKVFGHDVGTSTALGGDSRSIIRWRRPEQRERAAATIFAKALDRIYTPDRRSAKVNTDNPGGRLRTRAVIQQRAARANGDPLSRHQIWRKTEHTVTPKPLLRVGILLDVSGSMRAEAALAGSLTYVVASAVQQQGGLFSMVAFGSDVHQVVRPGAKVEAVPAITPQDGFENIRDGLLALDHVLDLTNGDGLKICLLISDGQFVHADQSAFADQHFGPMVRENNVMLIQVDCSGGGIMLAERRGHNLRHGNPLPVVEVPAGAAPDVAAKIVADAMLGIIARHHKAAV